MSNPYLSDNYSSSPYHDESRSPASDRSERFSQYSSDEYGSAPYSGQSSPKTTKTKETYADRMYSFVKSNRSTPKDVSHSRNDNHQKSYIATDIKGKGSEFQLKKSRDSSSSPSNHSYGGSYLDHLRQQRYTDDFSKKNGQYSSELKGRTEDRRENEERRVPVEPKKTKKDSVCKGTREEYKEIVQGKNSVKSQREGGRNNSEYFNHSGETSELLKSLAKKKWEKHIELSDISETVSEFCYLDDSNVPIKSKSASKGREKMPLDQFGLGEKNLDDPMHRISKTSNKAQQKAVRNVQASADEEGVQTLSDKLDRMLEKLDLKKKGNFESQDRSGNRNMRQSKNQEKNIRVTNAQTLNQSGYSDELSYKSSQSDDEYLKKPMTKLQKQYEEEMRIRAREDLEKFNYASIGVTKEGRMSEKFKKEKSDLYFKFCKDAGEHPIEYYRRTGKKDISKENLEDRIRTLLENDGFDTDNLVFTKQGLPSKSSVSKSMKNWLVKYGYYDEV